MGAGDQQGHVVAGPGRQQRVQDRLAGLLRRAPGAAEDGAELLQAGVDVTVPVLDQSVGVEDELAALGQLQLDRLEGHPAESEGGADGRSTKVTVPSGATTAAAGARRG